jgi:hypothetical protein
MKALRCLFFLLPLTLSGCFSGVNEEVAVPDSSGVVAGLKTSEEVTKSGLGELRSAARSVVSTSLGTPQETKAREIAARLVATTDKIEQVLKETPASESVALIAALNKCIVQLKALNRIKDAEIAKLKEANARKWYWILYGGGTFFAVVAGVTFFGGSSIPGIGPLLGPRIAWLSVLTSGTLYTLGYLYDLVQKHPGWAAAAVAVLLGSIFGLGWANHVDNKRERAKT